MEDRERIAAEMHAIWSHWMWHIFSVCIDLPGGDMVIPKGKVSRWDRQVVTPYAKLPEATKESDRHQADKIIAIICGKEE